MRSWRGWFLLVVGALLGAACGGSGSVDSTTADTTTALEWSLVLDDDAVSGGARMNGVTAGGPGFVAVGSEDAGEGSTAAVWTSPDGVTWSRVPHDENVFGGQGLAIHQLPITLVTMISVTAGGPGLVAVGSDNRDAAVWTSPDGVEWTPVPYDESVFGGFGSQGMNSVTAGGPGLVAVGTDDSLGNAKAAVWISSDGVTWSRVAHDEAVFGEGIPEVEGEQHMKSVTAGGPGLVAVGSEWPHLSFQQDAALWTSPDGVTWTRLPRDVTLFGGEGNQAMESVTFGGPGLVAVGRAGPNLGLVSAAVWTSPNGVTWSRVPHDEQVFGGGCCSEMWSVTAGGPGLVAVGTVSGTVGTSGAVWTSPDGVTWSRVPHDEAVFGGRRSMWGVAAAGSSLVAVGTDIWVAVPED